MESNNAWCPCRHCLAQEFTDLTKKIKKKPPMHNIFFNLSNLTDKKSDHSEGNQPQYNGAINSFYLRRSRQVIDLQASCSCCCCCHSDKVCRFWVAILKLLPCLGVPKESTLVYLSSSRRGSLNTILFLFFLSYFQWVSMTSVKKKSFVLLSQNVTTETNLWGSFSSDSDLGTKTNLFFLTLKKPLSIFFLFL